jgi:hypothetical protein
MSATSIAPVAARRLDAAALLGTWINTNAQSRGITRIDVRQDDGGLLHISFEGFEATSLPYSIDGFDSDEGLAFLADDGRVRLQANIKGGVLVVAAMRRAEVNTWVREFYYRRAQ